MLETVGVFELMVFVAMVGGFFVGAFWMKLPIGIAMGLGALCGVVVSGRIFPLDDLSRHLVEGMFAYFDVILIIATATIFMFSIERNGLLQVLTAGTIRTFRNYPVMLLAAITLIIMFPGMLTGSSTAAVLTTGALMAPVLMHMGVPRAKAGAVIAMAALFGMAAPPVNIPALIIGAGVDLPYVGLDLPLLVLSLPIALVTTWWLALPHCRKAATSAEGMQVDPGPAARHGIKLFLPLAVVAGLLVGERVAPEYFNLGLPLIFLIGMGVAAVTGERFPVGRMSMDAMRTAMPILGILMGVGMFIQIMTLTGARGEVVIQALQLPRGWLGLYPIIGTTMPLFGSVSSFGAASVLGVPYLLALPTSSDVIIMNAAALSSIVALGDLMPPTALAGIFAAQVVNEEKYVRVLKWCILPGVVACIQGLLAIQFAEPLARYLVRLGGG